MFAVWLISENHEHLYLYTVYSCTIPLMPKWLVWVWCGCGVVWVWSVPLLLWVLFLLQSSFNDALYGWLTLFLYFFTVDRGVSKGHHSRQGKESWSCSCHPASLATGTRINHASGHETEWLQSSCGSGQGQLWKGESKLLLVFMQIL